MMTGMVVSDWHTSLTSSPSSSSQPPDCVGVSYSGWQCIICWSLNASVTIWFLLLYNTSPRQCLSILSCSWCCGPGIQNRCSQASWPRSAGGQARKRNLSAPPCGPPCPYCVPVFRASACGWVCHSMVALGKTLFLRWGWLPKVGSRKCQWC
jgi:hypothetical protein